MPRERNKIINMELTGLNIKNLMKKRGISIQSVMEKLCISSHQSIYSWFEGATLPSVDNMLALSVILDVPVDLILVTNTDSFAGRRHSSHFIDIQDLPADDYNRMASLMREYSVPFQELLSLYEGGFEFCSSADKYDPKVE